MVDLSNVPICEDEDGCDIPAAYDMDGQKLCELHAEQCALRVLLAVESGKWRKMKQAVNGVEDERIFTTEEACDFLRTSKATLGRYLTAKTIPVHKLGRKNIFLKSELINWVRRKQPNL